MEIPENIVRLIHKYHAGTLTPAETSELNVWYHSFDDSEISLDAGDDETEQQIAERIKSRLRKTIHGKDNMMAVNHGPNWRRFAAAVDPSSAKA